ncbi:MAG: phosphotriesterase-related protein [Dehalococcoidia bacterium]|nr:phosphotriesterase-related protein [Dehalococcoidia bacterium]
MTTINSVLGPLGTVALGFTLMHEHIIVASAGIPLNYPELLGADFMERIVDGLTQAKEGGIDTIVDATTLDLGRDVTVLAEASRLTGVNIIACTGWWLEIPRFLAGVSADQLAELFIREIREGISGTDIKAGILKSASDIFGVTSAEEPVLRAVARAHLETKVPIMLHSYSPGRVGEQQLAILKEEGVDLRRVKVDHSNDTTDVEYLVWLLEQGCYLGLDRYPGRNVSPLARTKTMKALIDAGYGDRLLPSHDWSLAQIEAETPIMAEEERELRNPHGYLYIKKVVFPQLREMGVSEATLNSLCVDGPRNFFEGV